MGNNRRNFGLDVMRTIAILLVVFGHTFEHLRLPAWIANLGRTGGLGVEVFFALSGFLIGGILLRLVASDQFNNVRDLGDFWFRRWMRTLPLYYFFLALSWKYDWRGPTTWNAHRDYFFFLQNFFRLDDAFFAHSWSLAIEEWFYLTFPIVLLIAWRVFRKPVVAIGISVAVFLVVPAVVRASLAPFSDYQAYNFSIRMAVASRLDSIMFGVLMAAVSRYRPELWKKLRRATPISLACTTILFAYHYQSLPGILEHGWIQVWMLGACNLCFALLIPWFAEIGSSGSQLVNRFISSTSKVSYSMYLCHPFVLGQVNQYVEALGARPMLVRTPWLALVVYLICIYMASSLTYWLVEKPFLAWRDRVSSATAPQSTAYSRWILASLGAVAVLAIIYEPLLDLPYKLTARPVSEARVYIDRSNHLVYTNERCSRRELENRFFLHIYPRANADLTGHALDGDFINRDFDAVTYLETPLTDDFLGPCKMRVPLPEVSTSRVEFGQTLVPNGICCTDVWTMELIVDG